MAWPCRTAGAALPCGLDPARCPLAGRPRCKIETDPQSRLLRHFEKPGTAFVFGPEAGCGRRTLAARLREAGIETIEISGDVLSDSAASETVQRLIFARARGEKTALFATGLEALRRWCENKHTIELTDDGKPVVRWVGTDWELWKELEEHIRAGSSERANRLVMALGICDKETSELFGLRQGEILGPQKAAVLLE